MARTFSASQQNAATYVINHPEFGWQAFGGNVTKEGDWIKIQPLDAFRQCVYVAPRGLWLTLDAGTFESVEIHAKTHAVRIGLSRANAMARQARLRMDQPARVAGVGAYRLKQKFPAERGGFVVPLRNEISLIDLVD